MPTSVSAWWAAETQVLRVRFPRSRAIGTDVCLICRWALCSVPYSRIFNIYLKEIYEAWTTRVVGVELCANTFMLLHESVKQLWFSDGTVSITVFFSFQIPQSLSGNPPLPNGDAAPRLSNLRPHYLPWRHNSTQHRLESTPGIETIVCQNRLCKGAFSDSHRARKQWIQNIFYHLNFATINYWYGYQLKYYFCMKLILVITST